MMLYESMMFVCHACRFFVIFVLAMCIVFYAVFPVLAEQSRPPWVGLVQVHPTG